MTSSDDGDVTAPMSRHNLHVTDETDLIDIPPWSQEQLYAAVERADSEDGVVVLDYGREQLYVVDTESVTYRPPSALGLTDDPGLRVDRPRRYEPGTDTLGRVRRESTLVSPEFDILVPAFDWTEPDDTWDPPELTYRDSPSDTPAGALGG